MPRRSLSLDARVFLLAFLAGLPGCLFLLGWLWGRPHDMELRWTLTILILSLWLGLSRAAQMTVVRPMQTVSNLLAALREEDFSFRARGRGGDDALSQVLYEVNTLAETLKHQRLGALEATGLSDLVVAGGVGANRLLRERLEQEAGRRGVRLYFPRLEFCTDNAAMIAVAGLLRLKRGDVAPGLAIEARAQWPLDTLKA